MKVYKRGVFSLIKSLLIAIIAPVFLGFLISAFTDNMIFILAIPAAIFLFLLKSAIFSENIKFELSESGEFKYYVRNNLKETYNLADCSIGYSAKSTNGDEDYIYLTIVNSEGENRIECTALELNKFYKMYEEMEAFTIKQEKKVIKAKKKEEN